MTAHPMLVFSRPAQERAAVASWVRSAVAGGERVVLRFAPTIEGTGAPDVATLSGELAAAGVDPVTIDTGQVQFLDAATLGAVTGGRRGALHQVYVGLVERARLAGYAGLAVTGDAAALRASTRDEQELHAHERDLDRLTRELPLRVLCRYGSDERPELLAGMAGVHHRATTDVHWGAELVHGTLSVRGEIDISNADRLAAVLHAARLEGTRCVDLSELRFCSAAGLGVLAAAAASSPADRPLVLRNPGRSLARLLQVLGMEQSGLRIENDADDVDAVRWPDVDERPTLVG